MNELAQSAAGLLQSLDWLWLGQHALSAAGGGALTLTIAYLTLMRDVTFIKGQLTQLNNDHATVEQLGKDLVVLRLDLQNHRERDHGKSGTAGAGGGPGEIAPRLSR